MCPKTSKAINFISKSTKDNYMQIWTISSIALTIISISISSFLQYKQQNLYKELTLDFEKIKKEKNLSQNSMSNPLSEKLQKINLKAKQSISSLNNINKLIHELTPLIPKEIRIIELFINHKKNFRLKCQAKTWHALTHFTTNLKNFSLITCPKLRKSIKTSNKGLIDFVLTAFLKY